MVSVIIPVYNGEKYIGRCLDSLLAQSYTDFEVITIDDGSADGSLAICQSYEQKDSRFRAIHQENQGVSAARNAGVDAATGEYIAFVDADDYILPDYLERLVADAQAHGADIACCDFVEILSEGLTSPNNPRVLRERLVQDPSSLFDDIIRAEEGYSACVWAKLIRTELARKVRFQKMRFGEDHVYMFDLFCHAPVVYLNTYQGYCYAPNEGSVTVKCSVVSVPRCADEMRMHKYKVTHLPEPAKALYERYYQNYARSVASLIGSVCRNGYPSEALQLAKDEVRQILQSGIPIVSSIRLRLQLFRIWPRLYGLLVHLLGK